MKKKLPNEKHSFNRLLRHLTLLLFSIVYCASIYAGPVDPTPKQLTQPDGTVITIRLFGDEWFNRAETLDGYTVMLNDEGWWVYAEKGKDGKLKPSDKKVSTQLKSASETETFLYQVGKHLLPDQVILDGIRKEREALYSKIGSQLKSAKADQKISGTWKVCVLLVEFNDLAHTITPQSFDDMFNQEGFEGGYGATGSFNDYYREISYGEFGIEADIYGWYQDDRSYTYYSYSQSDFWSRAKELVARTVELADTDVDFSKYDNDGDGNVEQIIVVHSGPGAAENNDHQYIWPHFFWLVA